MPLRSKFVLSLFGFVALSFGSAMTAKADSCTVVGINGFTNATAIINVTSLTATTLTFTVQNTSAQSSTRITGIGVDVTGTDDATSGTFPAAFQLSMNGDGFSTDDADFDNVQGFANADPEFGFISGTNFNGGGSGGFTSSAGVLTFTATGNFAQTIAAGSNVTFFLRFQSVPDPMTGQGTEGSTTGSCTACPPTTVIPEPTTMLLLGTGLAGIAAKVRRRRKS